jgi:chlorobactene glucosyltransferase
MSPLELLVAVPAAFATAALLVILAIALLNLATFPRLRVPDRGGPAAAAGPAAPTAEPRVSILVPARDEAAVIGRTVEDLRSQTLEDIEILVLDDGSTDGTATVARAAAGDDPRTRVLTGKPLPAGWAGKPWACAQLADEARGELLLFTDADTRWAPRALEALLAERERTAADLLTAWPTQETVSWAERLAVPMMAYVVQGYLPALAVHHLPWPAFVAAMGQCLLFTRHGYTRSGGHAAVRDTVLDDMALARRLKAAGGRLREADANGLIGCRMYTGWPSVRDGFAKNMLAGYAGSLLALAAAAAFHWLIHVLPWAWLLVGLVAPSSTPWWPWWPLALVALGIAGRVITAVATRQRARDSILLPVSALLMTAVAWRSARWARSGGPRWKGRVVASRRDGGRES